jgi:hypothetical protein
VNLPASWAPDNPGRPASRLLPGARTAARPPPDTLERHVHEDKAPSIGEYAKRLAGALRKEIGENTDLLVEPGRSMVAPVGLTLYRIVTI